MIVLRYGTELDPESIEKEYNYIKQVLPNEKILCLPQDWDILFNCDIDQLRNYRNRIDTMINLKSFVDIKDVSLGDKNIFHDIHPTEIPTELHKYKYKKGKNK